MAPSSSSGNRIDELVQQLSQFQIQLTTTVADIATRLETLERRTPEPTSGSFHGQNPPPPPPSTQTTPHLKLDVPRFDGQNANGWIFKISQFFTYHNTPDEERITIASFYLDGPALAWYQWMYRNGQIVFWHQFLQALELRFAPTAYDDPRGRLFKLHQTSTVAVYLSEFEALTNHIVGLSPPDLLSCFISGLRSDIRREVLAQQPASLTQAAGLARLQEEKLQDLLRMVRPRQTPSWSPPPPACSTPSSPAHPPLLPTPPAPPRFRQLTPAEMADRREKGIVLIVKRSSLVITVVRLVFCCSLLTIPSLEMDLTQVTRVLPNQIQIRNFRALLKN
jgi:hypothetical protein